MNARIGLAIAVTAACGAAASSARAQQCLSTIFSGGINGASLWTVYWDITTAAPVNIGSFAVSTTNAVGTAFSVDVYVTAAGGTHVGNTSNPAAWTLVGSGSGTTAAPNTPSVVDTSDFLLGPGTYGMAIRYTGVSPSYTTGNGANQSYTDGILTLNLGRVQATTTAPFTGGSPFSPRVWNGRICYSIGVVVGACCKPDGTCIQTSQGGCASVSGVYQGDNAECADIGCPPPGACCLPNNTCSVLSSAQCTAQQGIYQGDGTTCAVTGCPNMGGCCLVDGSCQLAAAAGCTALGGTYSGNATVCASVACPQPVCYTATGLAVPIPDSPLAGTPGPTATGTLTVPGNQTITSMFVGIRVAHAFQGDMWVTLKHPDGTALDLVTRPGVAPPKATNNVQSGFGNDNYGAPPAGAYMTFIDSAASVYDDAVGYPGPPPGAVVAGGIAGAPGSWRAHGGSLNTAFGTRNVHGNWRLLVNDYWPSDTGTIDAIKVCIAAPLTAVCYPNCDHSTVDPCLNVQDFSCFLNSFANNETYANCDHSIIVPVLNVQDFSCFLNAFANGCSSC